MHIINLILQLQYIAMRKHLIGFDYYFHSFQIFTKQVLFHTYISLYVLSCIFKSNSLFPGTHYCIISRKIPKTNMMNQIPKAKQKKQSNIHSLNQEGYYYYKEQSTAIQKFTNFYLKFFSHVFRNFTIKDYQLHNTYDFFKIICRILLTFANTFLIIGSKLHSKKFCTLFNGC